MGTSRQWQLARDAAERYEAVLVPAILGPAARRLVEWAGVRPGEAVVDIGCGTGAAARLAAVAAGASGRLAGVDVNGGMIDVARSLPPVQGAAIHWVEAGVHALPFPDGGFDLALCAQTLQFVEDRPSALAEVHRILRPGGRVVVSLWCDIEANPYFHVLTRAIARHIGPDTAGGLLAAFGLSDPHRIRTLLAGAGFVDVGASVATFDLPLPEPREFVPRHIGATPMAQGFAAAPQEVRRAVVEEVVERLGPGKGEGAGEGEDGLRVPFATHLVAGARA